MGAQQSNKQLENRINEYIYEKMAIFPNPPFNEVLKPWTKPFYHAGECNTDNLFLRMKEWSSKDIIDYVCEITNELVKELLAEEREKIASLAYVTGLNNTTEGVKLSKDELMEYLKEFTK